MIIMVIDLKRKIIGFFVVGVLGTLFHFAYDFFNRPLILSFMLPIDESIFEHLKLIFFPTIIYMLIDLKINKENRREYFISYIYNIFIANIITIVFFYTYYGMFGINVDFINIAIYFIAILSIFINLSEITTISRTKAIILGIIMLASLIIFTYYKPNIPFFTQFN